MTPTVSPARVVVFATGSPIALGALRALRTRHEVVAVIRLSKARHVLLDPWRRIALASAARIGFSTPDPLSNWARSAGIPVISTPHGNDTGAAARVGRLAPDFGCIATFPARIGPNLLEAAGRVCVNLHPSLLPRHRGSDPLFWTYHAGDREGGVSTHAATAELDAGPVIGRTACPIERGEPATAVHARYVSLGAALLVETVTALASGTAAPEPQDDSAATLAPRVKTGVVYSDLETWSVEHAWHFLSGLAERYQEPFEDVDGLPVPYRRVPGHRVMEPRHAPGAILRDGAGWNAWTKDGMIHLAP